MKIKPVVFSEDDKVYKELKKTYVTHDKGLFILAPSGTGKTHFCKSQKVQHWIDGDELWIKTGAHPDGPWWKEPLEVLNEVDQRSDVITIVAKKLGFWIMGASSSFLPPDAIVIPDWEQHKEFIRKRVQVGYDGGAKPEDFKQVQNHITWIESWHTEHGVPRFKSIESAVSKLTS